MKKVGGRKNVEDVFSRQGGEATVRQESFSGMGRSHPLGRSVSEMRRKRLDWYMHGRFSAGCRLVRGGGKRRGGVPDFRCLKAGK